MPIDDDYYRGDTLEFRPKKYASTLVGKYITFTIKNGETDPDPGLLQKKFQAPDTAEYQNQYAFIEVPATDMEAVPVGTFWYDVQVYDNAFTPPKIKTIEKGRLTVLQDISQSIQLPTAAGTPQVLSFILPASHTTSTDIPITTFVAENHTHYMFAPTTTPAVPPALDDAGWIAVATPAATIAAGAEGDYIYTAWVKNATTVSAASAAQLCTVDMPSTIAFSASTSAVNEGAQITLSITRTGNPHGEVVVDLVQIAGAAVLGVDYTLSASRVTFASGDAVAKSVTLTAAADLSTEGSETATLQVNIFSGQAAYGATRTNVVTIADTSTSNPSTLHYTNLFNGAWGDATLKFDENSSFSLSTAHANEGTHSARIRNQGTYKNTVDGKHRTYIECGDKVYPSANKFYPDPMADTWHGFAIYIPNDGEAWPVDTEGAVLLMQLVNGNVGPEFSIQAKNGGNDFAVRHAIGTDPNATPKVVESQYGPDFPIIKGAQNRFVVHRMRSITGAGLTQVWVNNSDKNNPDISTAIAWGIDYVAMGSTGNIWFDVGMYWGPDNRAGDFVAYVDSVRHAYGSGDLADLSGFDLVSPYQ